MWVFKKKEDRPGWSEVRLEQWPVLQAINNGESLTQEGIAACLIGRKIKYSPPKLVGVQRAGPVIYRVQFIVNVLES